MQHSKLHCLGGYTDLCAYKSVVGRASVSRLREPGFESCAAVFGQVFSLYIAPVHSAV